MATKLNTRSTKKNRRVLGGKRMVFDQGRAKNGGCDLPLKTAEVETKE